MRLAVLAPVSAQSLHVRPVRHQAWRQPYHARRAGHERHHVRRHGRRRRSARGEDAAPGNPNRRRAHRRRRHALHFAADHGSLVTTL